MRKNRKMKTKLRLKIIWESTITKIVLVLVLVGLLLSAIILPSVLTSRPKGSVLAFNRDAASGTREAFVEKVLDEDKHTWTPGGNVREVRNNDAMITFVQREENSMGYVSFGTVASFSEESLPEEGIEIGDPILRTDRNGMDKISFATFNGIKPTKDNIFSGEYEAARNFNSFFRVKQDSNESQILNFDWDTMSLDEVSKEKVNQTEYANDLKGAYLFYNWFLTSNEASNIINESGELTYSFIEDGGETRKEFDKVLVDQYIDATGLNSDEQILIEIVGSTSATAVMTDLTNAFDEEITEAYELEEEDLKFVIATNGSSDALHPTVAGTDHPFIGMQSKDQSAEGFVEEGWGELEYFYDESTGTYNSDVYGSFAKDAILIIFNAKGMNNEECAYNISRDSLVDLYTYDEYLYYEDLLTPNTEDGGELYA